MYMIPKRIDQTHRLYQPEDGYRFSIDAFLLAAFAARYRPVNFLDMGAGCGVVSWQLSQLLPSCEGLAIEIQDTFIPFARKNLKTTRVRLLHSDVRNYQHVGPQFDMLVSNPPYFKPGHGKLSKNPVKAIARHALNGDVHQWVEHVLPWLSSQGGVCLVYPFRYASQLRGNMEYLGLYVSESIDVCSYADTEPKLCCLYFKRQAMPETRKQLVLYHGHRKRTPEAVKFLHRTLQEGNFL